MKAIRILSEYPTVLTTFYVLYPKQYVKEAIAELEEINSRICCENCQQFDPLSKICYQNGCNDYEDWILWKPKESNDINYIN